jgi:hypothetical protein
MEREVLAWGEVLAWLGLGRRGGWGGRLVQGLLRLQGSEPLLQQLAACSMLPCLPLLLQNNGEQLVDLGLPGI